ncbi:hypothetical protein ONS95_014102 [Cadophora gregata]|uniref:uncharacterized protein n=1 Tax=Cadophora gregata TaxID=51156 RepID=UPI0026DDC24C|nr:uncharacterized protein ONS95_014102 [Cadophora gregata]KAK0113856.1 hypothetical protein ONS96_014708 [Cadophora gregata f. sp. sojae]KAK0114617.1 hypothetical protein ONS95_014102 [Cadophora gregata]
MASGGDINTPQTPESLSSTAVRQWSEFVLDKPPSCVEFIPKSGSKFGNLLVVGSYELQPDEVSVELADSSLETEPTTTSGLELEKQKREGSLTLLKLSPVTNTLEVLHTLERVPAIYDLHFLPGQDIFAVATSTGAISFYYVKEKMLFWAKGKEPVHEIAMQPIFSAQVFPKTTIITFFQFIPAQPPYHGSLISATTNDGGTYLMEYCLDNGEIQLLNDGEPITTHMLPYANTLDYVWCCGVSAKQPVTIFSGGDGGDLVQDIISFGLVAPFSYDSNKKLSRSHKFHDAGVTAILPLTPSSLDDEELLLTGSYDEYVRLYSTDNKNVLAKLKLDGGVYRLKNLGQVNWFLPQSTTYAILACCMHAGTKIIHVKGSMTGDWSIEVVACLDVPSSDPATYCYAAAARPSGPLPSSERIEEKRLCVSGTWVDKKLVVWEFTHEFERPKDDVVEEGKSTGIHVPYADPGKGVQNHGIIGEGI